MGNLKHFIYTFANIYGQENHLLHVDKIFYTMHISTWTTHAFVQSNSLQCSGCPCWSSLHHFFIASSDFQYLFWMVIVFLFFYCQWQTFKLCVNALMVLRFLSLLNILCISFDLYPHFLLILDIHFISLLHSSWLEQCVKTLLYQIVSKSS